MKPKLNNNDTSRDLMWTPPYATEALCDFLAKEVGGHVFEGQVWEPACGEMFMVDELRDYFTNVMFSDLNKGIDFLGEFTEFQRAWIDQTDCIITNPPYTAKLKYGFIERCVELDKPFALLMPTETISSSKAQALFDRVGGVTMLHFDTRVDFKQQGKTWSESQAQFPTAWFISWNGLAADKNYFVSIKEAKKKFKSEMKAIEAPNEVGVASC